MMKRIAAFLSACMLLAQAGCASPAEPVEPAEPGISSFHWEGELSAVRVLDESGEMVDVTLTAPETLSALAGLLENAPPWSGDAGGPVHLLEAHTPGYSARIAVALGDAAVFEHLGQCYELDGGAYRDWLDSLGEEIYHYSGHPSATLSAAEGLVCLAPTRTTYEYLRLDGGYASAEQPDPPEEVLLPDWTGPLPLPPLDREPAPVFGRVDSGGERIYEGGDPPVTLEAGSRYDIVLTADYTGGATRGEVSYTYSVEMAAPPPPPVEFEVRGAETDPGEVVVLRVKNLPEGEVVSCTTSIQFTPTFYPDGEGVYTALLPVSYYTQPGGYSVSLSAGGMSETFPITVRNKQFEVQHLTVDSETTAQTIESAEANAEYNRLYYPLRFVADGARHWEGRFTRPAEGGEISTPFAVIRYTNNDPTPSRHGAIGVSLDRGEPVYAPARGRVQFAGFLRLTGNTIMIEHGFGLKTWYYHMDSLAVATGDMVLQGRKLGEVGSTGFSTGPHLHYGMSVREIMINPDTAQLTDLLAFD